MTTVQKVCVVCLQKFSKRTKEARKDFATRATCGEKSCVTEYQRRVHLSKPRDCANCGASFTPFVRNLDEKLCRRCRHKVPTDIKAIPLRGNLANEIIFNAKDREQMELNKLADGSGHTSPVRVLTKKEIAAIAHTITPMHKIPQVRNIQTRINY